MSPRNVESPFIYPSPIAARTPQTSATTSVDKQSEVSLAAPNIAGAPVTLNGRVVPTEVDAQIAEQQKPYEGLVFPVYVEAVVPMERLAFRWHPYSIEPGGDYSNEPTTLVTFDLADAPGGVLLTIVESGFEQIPVARRAEAFKANETGWEEQTRLIAKYLDAHAHA